MKKHIIICLIVMLPIYMTGCYDDKSSNPDSPIDEVVIDATGISEEIYVGYLEELVLAPAISKGENKNDDSGLLYEWAITESSSSTTFTFETVSREKELRFIVNRPVSFAPYIVKLTVTDNENGGLQFLRTWNIYVQSTFSDGLLVSNTHDGQTSDFIYIKNGTLSMDYADVEKVYRNILTEINGLPYQGLLSSLTYEVCGYTTGSLEHTNQVWALTPEGYCTRFDCSDFSVNGNSDSESLLTYKPDGFKFSGFFKGCQSFYAITNYGIYSFFITENVFSWYDALIKDTKFSGNIVAANSSSEVYYNHTVFLDKTDGKFRSYTTIASFAECSTYIANNVFDPNAMQNKTAVAAGITENASVATFLLKDNNTGNYGIYTLTQRQSAEVPASAGNMYAVSSSGKILLDEAVSVFFAQKELVMYVATENGIYAITYGSGNTAIVNETARFTANGEKITKAKLYQQGQYVNDIAIIAGRYPKITPLPWNNQAVIVTTQSSEFEGKVYVVPITQPGIGTMDISQALVYDGFGKILDVITIGY